MASPDESRKRRRLYAVAAVFVLLASLFALRQGRHASAVALPDPQDVVKESAIVAPPVPEAKRVAAARPAATRTAAPASHQAPKKTKRSPAVLVEPREFRVRDVRVDDDGYRATIRGAIWLDRKGVIAQPLLRYELRDRDGVVVRTGEFTPGDAAGPLWIGYGYDGLKAVPFALDLDLRRAMPGRTPRAPFSASVKPIAVVDAKLR